MEACRIAAKMVDGSEHPFMSEAWFEEMDDAFEDLYGIKGIKANFVTRLCKFMGRWMGNGLLEMLFGELEARAALKGKSGIKGEENMPLLEPAEFKWAYFCCADPSFDESAAAPQLRRGGESRRRRGCDVDSPRRRVAATPRLRRG